MNITEEMLRAAAPAVCMALSDSFPAEEDCRHRFSFAFHRKMRPLLREQKGERKHPVLRRVAAVFLAAMVGVGAWLTVDTDARAAFLRWVKEVYETQIVYRFFGEEAAAEPGDYLPAWLPEGYKEVKRYELSSQILITYENQSGERIYYSCMQMKEGAAAGVIPEGAAVEQVEVVDLPGTLYLDAEGDDPNMLIWIDQDAEMYFDLSSYYDKSVMLHIADSIYLTD